MERLQMMAWFNIYHVGFKELYEGKEWYDVRAASGGLLSDQVVVVEVRGC